MRLRDAWLEVAEAYHTPHGKRTDKQARLTDWGLCSAIMDVAHDIDQVAALSRTVRTLEERDYLAPVRISSYPYTSVENDEADQYRATLACLFAAMTDQERNEFLEIAK